MKPTPVIVDTDIGSNIDDAYALLLAATAPELELRGVTTVNTDPLLRASIAWRLLDLLNQREVPVLCGEANALDGASPTGWYGFEGQGVDLEGYEMPRIPATEWLKGQLRAAVPPVLIAIGQLTNIALALDDLSPAECTRVKIYAMAGSLAAPQRETNTAADPLAVERVLGSGAKLRFVPLDVTRRTSMNIEQLEILARLRRSLPDFLVTMHSRYLQAVTREDIALHDPLTVASVIDPAILSFQAACATVSSEERLLHFEGGEPNCEVAVDLNLSRFQALFWSRVLAACDGRRIR